MESKLDALEGEKLKIATDLFSSHPRLVLKKAEEGCHSSMLAIVDALEAPQYPPTLFADTLALFTSCLSNISPTGTLCPHHTGIVFNVLVGIRHVCSLNAKRDSTLMRILLESSPSFISWARFFVTDGQVRHALPLQTMMNSFLTTLGWIYLHASEEEISQCSLNESDLLDLVVHIWLVDGSDGNAGDDDWYMCASLFNAYLTKTGVCKASLDAVLKMAHGKADRLSGLTLRRLSDAAHSEPPVFRIVKLCISLLSKFSSVKSHPLDLEIWTKTGMTVLSKSINSLYGSLQGLIRTEETLSTLELCFALLSKALTTGAFRVLQAIESGILRSIITCHATLDRHGGFSTRLLDTFSSCLISHPSILSAVETVIVSIPRGIYDRVLKSAMGDRWKRFFGLFLERFLLRYYYVFHKDLSRTCEQCGSTEKGKEYALKQCGYCKQVLYCSEKCQIAAWRKHKKDCKLLKLQYRDVTAKNVAFIRFLAEHDVRRHLPGLRILASRKYPSVNFQDLAISIDYSSSPPTLDVAPAIQLELLSKETPVVAPCGQLLRNPNFDEARGSKDELGIMKLRFSSATAEPLVSYHNFPMLVPYFCSMAGSSRRRKDAGYQSVHATEFLDLDGHSVQATWDIANEIMLRCGVTPNTYIGENTCGDVKEMSAEELNQQLELRLSAMMAGECDLRDYLWKASRS